MRILKELLPLAFLAALGLAGLTSCSEYPKNPESAKISGLAVGAADGAMEPKDFSLPDRNGRLVQLSGLRGKPILLNFWASWCQPCIDELPALVKFADWAKREQGVETVGVSVDESWVPVKVLLGQKKFWRGAALPITILLNADGGVSASYGCSKYPESYFIDKNFKVIRKFIGAQDWTSQEIKKWITEHSK